jgi:IS5 family transposase
VFVLARGPIRIEARHLSDRLRHRGIFKVGWVFTFAAAAYNLVRMRNLAAVPSA